MPLDETKPANAELIKNWPAYIREVRDEVNSLAASMLNGFTSVSTTSKTIATGTISITIEANKAFVPGQAVSIVNTAAPADEWMWGSILSYDSVTGDLSVNVTKTLGSGAIASWVIGLSADPSAITVNDVTYVDATTTPNVLISHSTPYVQICKADTSAIPVNISDILYTLSPLTHTIMGVESYELTTYLETVTLAYNSTTANWVVL